MALVWHVCEGKAPLLPHAVMGSWWVYSGNVVGLHWLDAVGWKRHCGALNGCTVWAICLTKPGNVSSLAVVGGYAGWVSVLAGKPLVLVQSLALGCLDLYSRIDLVLVICRFVLCCACDTLPVAHRLPYVAKLCRIRFASDVCFCLQKPYGST